MTNHIISLPENIYRRMLAIAKAQGVSPVSWLESQVSKYSDVTEPSDELSEDANALPNNGRSTIPEDAQKKSLYELLVEAGTFDELENENESGVPHRRIVKKDDPFGDALIADMARQGIHIK